MNIWNEAEQESAKLKFVSKRCWIEFMKHTIKANTAFYIYPAKKNETFEFFYILEGEITSDDLKVTLTSGDYFSIKELSDISIFSCT